MSKKTTLIAEMSKQTGTLSTIVFTIFLVLKLAEIGPLAKWSWLWITSPIWIPTVLVILILLLFLLWYLIFKYPDEKMRNAKGMSEAGWKSYKKKTTFQERLKEMQELKKREQAHKNYDITKEE